MSLDTGIKQRDVTILSPLGRESEYKVVYQCEVPGWESPLHIELPDLPNPNARYRLEILVEQVTEATP